MIKIFSKYKTIFYFMNLVLLILYLYPGSLIGCYFYNDCKIQPQITRDLIITSDSVELEEENNDNEEQVYDPCPCPVYYKPIQHNYKLGSNASNVMRLSKIIMRRY